MNLMRQTREALGLNQTQLAHRLGVNQSSISRFETGQLPIDERTKLALEALLKTAPKPRRKAA